MNRLALILPLAGVLLLTAPLLSAATFLWLQRGATILYDLSAAGAYNLCH